MRHTSCWLPTPSGWSGKRSLCSRTPAHVHDLLAADPDPAVRIWLTSVWSWLTDKAKAALLSDADPEVRQAAEKQQRPAQVVESEFGHSPEVLEQAPLAERLARDGDARRRAIAAINPSLPDVTAQRGALPAPAARPCAGARAGRRPCVRLFLAENHPDPPGELPLRTVLEFKGHTELKMLRHPNFPRAGLRRFTASSNARERTLIPMDPYATVEMIEHLSHDPDLQVRRAAAIDARIPPPRLLELLDEEGIAEAAASNPSLPIEAMEKILSR